MLTTERARAARCNVLRRFKPLTSKDHVYGICRHPQYSGLLALCLSVCLLSRSADRLFYTLVLMVVLDKKADLEEQAMVHAHPDYARYLLQVPKFVPNVSVLIAGSSAAHASMANAQSGADGEATESLLRGSHANVRRRTASAEVAHLEHLAALATAGSGCASPMHPRLMDAH